MAISRATVAAVRFGYGFHPDQAPPNDAAGLLAELAAPGENEPKISGLSAEARAKLFRQFIDIRKARKTDKSLTPDLKKAAAAIRKQFIADAAARIRAPIVSERGFFERLAWFWADHFTVNGKNNRGKLLAARFEAEAIRPHITGSFADMLRAASTHPAMISFLDQFQSVGPESPQGKRRGKGLNENLAREIIELHTLGVGASYSQTDVRQFAELLTGLSLNQRRAEANFKPQMAEPGAETVLGKSYGDDGPAELADIHQALDDLARHPETGFHIARKLAVHFIADDPSQALVNHLADAFNRSGGRLMRVYEALLEHPEAWTEPGAKVKQPFDYIVSSVRAAGLTEKEMKPLLRPRGDRSMRLALSSLNQPVYEAPGPDGWPEEAPRWITAQGLAARLTWATTLGRQIERRVDPRTFLATALGERASTETTFAATRAAERWEGIALVLASPEFNRR